MPPTKKLKLSLNPYMKARNRALNIKFANESLTINPKKVNFIYLAGFKVPDISLEFIKRFFILMHLEVDIQKCAFY